MSDDAGDGPASHETDPGSAPDGDGADPRREVTTYLLWASLAVLSLLALVATVRFYTSASRAIVEFVSPRYRELFAAAFNLAVLLAALSGIAFVTRRLPR